MYFQRVAEDLIVDLDKVWVVNKSYNKDNEQYTVEFCLSDNTTVFVHVEDEDTRDSIFDTVCKILEELTKMRNKEISND